MTNKRLPFATQAAGGIAAVKLDGSATVKKSVPGGGQIVSDAATLRAVEQGRFDAMAEAVRADNAITKADATKRLARIERLRALVG